MSARLRFEAPRIAPEFDFRSQASVLPLLRPLGRTTVVVSIDTPRSIPRRKAKPAAGPVLSAEELVAFRNRSAGQKQRFEKEKADRKAMWDAAFSAGNQ